MKRRHAALLILLLLPLRADAENAATVVLQSSGPARVLASVPRDDGLALVKFSSVFELTVEVDGGPALEVEAPTVWTTSPGWKIKNVLPPTMTNHEAGRRWRQSFVLDPVSPAAAAVELRPLLFRNDDGPWQTVDFKKIAVKVVVHMPSADPGSMREHAVVEDPEQAPVESEWNWTGPAIAAAAVVLLAIAVVVGRRRRRAGRNRSCEEIALYELGRLEALSLPERGCGGEFHTLLANVVRRYLEKRFQLPARRLTTQEFAVLLEQTPLFSAEQADFLKKFLHQCDLAKFAEARVSAADCVELCRQTRSFLSSAGTPQKQR